MENEIKPEENMIPAEQTIEELKQVIVEMCNEKHQEQGADATFSRCHPVYCKLAWMWPIWHPTPPHVPLYPTNLA